MNVSEFVWQRLFGGCGGFTAIPAMVVGGLDVALEKALARL
jgi:hypothetical protein